MEVAGPLGTPLGLAQRKRASPRGEAGTSGFLSVSDSDRTVPVVFPVVMYGCESWTVKKAEHRRIDAFELWCWATAGAALPGSETPVAPHCLRGKVQTPSLEFKRLRDRVPPCLSDLIGGFDLLPCQAQLLSCSRKSRPTPPGTWACPVPLTVCCLPPPPHPRSPFSRITRGYPL